MDSAQQDIMGRLSAAIEEWNADVTGMYGQLAEQLAAAQAKLNELVAAADAAQPSSEIEALKAQLSDRDDRIIQLDVSVAGLADDVQTLQATLARKEEECASLAGELEAVRSHDAAEESQIALLKAQLNEERERAVPPFPRVGGGPRAAAATRSGPA